MSFEKLIFLFFVGMFASCTGAVAPMNEDGGAATGTAKDTTSGGILNTPTNTDDDEITALGTISDETTDIASFVGKSTFMLNIASSGINILNIYDYVVGDTYFKKIVDYGPCEKTPTATTTAASTKSILLTFMKTFVPDAAHKVDDSGFPKEDNNTIASPAVTTAGVTGSYTDSTAPSAGITVKTGTINFSIRPDAVKDTYEVAVDLTLSNGKKYKATLEGVADATPTSTVTAPACPTGEYAPAIYE